MVNYIKLKELDLLPYKPYKQITLQIEKKPNKFTF